ncbi:MAG TPA: hypothetical protein VIJ18_00825 [Microbacteriaceae bacterium]
MSDTEYLPLKGDPDVLAAKAAHYASIADAIQRSVTTLHKIHDVDSMKSKATEALKSSADDVANDINKAHDRYSKTASALTTYSSVLRQAQDDANRAISQIDAKQSAASTAHQTASTAQQAVTDAKSNDKSTATTIATKADDAAQAADAALASAHQEWHNALDKKNTAAQVAIKAIVDVVDHHNNGLKNPGFWDNLVHWVEKIGDIAGILAIFLSWVPVLGQILIVVAAIASIIKLVDSIVKFANGEGTFLDILGAAVGTVLTLFGGRIFTFLGKAARYRSLTRAPQMLERAQTDVRAAARLRAGNAAMKQAAKDMFKVPSYATKAEYVSAIKQSFFKAAGEDRAAYKALFSGGSSRLDALGKLAGVNQATVRAVRDDIANGYKDPVAAAALFHQVQSLYNKGAGIANLPGDVKQVFGDGAGGPVPKLNLTNVGVNVGNTVAPTFKSYN